jgi:hypothetical protein
MILVEFLCGFPQSMLANDRIRPFTRKIHCEKGRKRMAVDCWNSEESFRLEILRTTTIYLLINVINAWYSLKLEIHKQIKYIFGKL